MPGNDDEEGAIFRPSMLSSNALPDSGSEIDCGVGWLNVFDAELSPKRFWRGKRSQEVGEERETNSDRERER